MSEQSNSAPELVGSESTINTNSEQYNSATKQAQQYHEEVNTAYNHHIIIEAIKSGRARDISDEPKAPLKYNEKMPCAIIGSGPSLDESIKFLKGWEGGIICSSSHALSLMYHGIEPTHILSLDPFDKWADLDGVDWSKTRTKLITHPGVWPDLIERWPNEMLLYIENNGRPDSFYAGTQKRMYSHREGESQRNPVFHYYIKTEITLFACSPPAQLFAAEVLGYGTIFLCGVDFGYTFEKNRFTSYTKENGEWVEHVHPYIPTDPHAEKWTDRAMLSNNGYPTAHVHVYYKKNFLSAWSLCGKTMYTTGPGILTEVPYASPKRMLDTQGYKWPQHTKQYIADKVEPYLASVGAFIIESQQGKTFIESQKPKEELVLYMHGMKARYLCDECKARMASNEPYRLDKHECPICKTGKLHPTTQMVAIDNDIHAQYFCDNAECKSFVHDADSAYKEHEGDECPQCKKGKLRHEVNVDIAANMARIEGYIKQAEDIKVRNKALTEEDLKNEELVKKITDSRMEDDAIRGREAPI